MGIRFIVTQASSLSSLGQWSLESLMAWHFFSPKDGITAYKDGTAVHKDGIAAQSNVISLPFPSYHF